MRIGVHKDQPVAGRRRRARISSARDLIDWLEDNNRAHATRDFRRRGPVGIVITHGWIPVSQPIFVKAFAADLVAQAIHASDFSSLNAGMTMEIFMRIICDSGRVW